MIRYALLCANGHQFESWFSNSAAFDQQSRAHLVSCPTCASTDVEKSLMAPNIAKKSNAKGRDISVRPTEIARLARELSKKVKENAAYVGDQFAEEARKIHYQEAPARGIWGQASKHETKSLEDEGITVHPLPTIPEDQN